ncbi:MAG: OmpH family outer membrane protein [Crocinitomicaceae bacterium]
MLSKRNHFGLFVFVLGTLISCNEQNNSNVVESNNPNVDNPNVEARKVGELKIAFYNQDSMKLYFEYYKKEDSIVTKKQMAFQKELEKKRKQMEDYYVSYLNKAQNNLLSQVEAEAYQRNLQNQEAELIKYQESGGVKLETETIAKLEEISAKIEQFSKSFCEKNNIDILLTQSKGGQFSYISPEMDVTKEFVDYLNAEQSKIESEILK